MSIEHGKPGRPCKDRLREIYELLQLDLPRDQISKMTGLKRKTVREYIYRLRKRLREQGVDLDENIRKIVQKTVQKNAGCPECGGELWLVEGAYVCTKCGLEQPFFDRDGRLPFDTTYALESSLSFGKSLGDTYPSPQRYGPRNVWAILAKAPAGKKDLPVRNVQIKQLIQVDPEKIRRLLRWGSRLLKKHGLDHDHALANHLGNNLRKLGRRTYFMLDGQKYFAIYKRIAVACLVLSLQKAEHQKLKDVKRELKYDSDLKFVRTYLEYEPHK